jgi:hypothetical protein
MNMDLSENTTIESRFQQEWTRWRLQEGKYSVMVTWWEKYDTWKTHFLFTQENAARIRIDMLNE